MIFIEQHADGISPFAVMSLGAAALNTPRTASAWERGPPAVPLGLLSCRAFLCNCARRLTN